MENFTAVGAFAERNSCRFAVWAPLKKKVEVIFDDDRNTLELEKNSEGIWSGVTEDVDPGTLYKFRVDGESSFPDPASRYQPLGVHGFSAVYADNFRWDDATWKGNALENLIIYELHVGTFSKEGTFEGVISKLDYLKELGVNAIEIMPVAQFPGDRNWGYDGVFPFAVQNSYGGPEGLKHLVNEAHRRNITVVLDVVYNHLGPEGNYLGEFAPYFTDKYKTFWGKAINFDDAYCDGARSYFLQNALMWLDEFRIDGLRLDAVHAIWDFSARHFVEELASRVRDLEARTGRKKILIAEFDLNNPRYINSTAIGGYGLDGQWIDEFHHSLHSLATGEVNGYYEDFGTINHLVKALKHSYVYTGEYSVHRKKNFGVPPIHNSYGQFVVFSQNHDQVGNRMLGDRPTLQMDFESLKLCAAVVLLAPQTPMLFMGEEYGERNPFLYFISHSDADLIKMVQNGRKQEFSYFSWKAEPPDPQAEETFMKSKISWEPRDNAQLKLFSFYKELIRLRKERVACQGKNHDSVKVYYEEEARIIGLLRTHKNDELFIIFNFDNAVVPYEFPDNITCRRKIIDSSSVKWGGNGEIAVDEVRNNSIMLNPRSTVIFQ